MNVEVPDFRGDGANNMLGVLSLELVVHSYKSRVNYLESDLVEKYVSQKEQQTALKATKFFQYSTVWWNDFKSLHKSFQNRAVKIYAKSCSIIPPNISLAGA